jgi:hypothetical protein
MQAGESTANVPGTHHGKLACAWVVNTTMQQVYGHPIAAGKAQLDVKETLQVIQKEPERFCAVDLTTAITSGLDYIVVTKTGITPGHGSHIGIGNGNTIYQNDSYVQRIVVRNTATWIYYYKDASYYLLKRK